MSDEEGYKHTHNIVLSVAASADRRFSVTAGSASLSLVWQLSGACGFARRRSSSGTGR